MITIALAGTAFVWITSISERGKGGAEGDVADLERQVGSSFSILMSNCSATSNNVSMTMYNNGNADILSGTATFIVKRGGEELANNITTNFPALTQGGTYQYNFIAATDIISGQSYSISITLPNNIVGSASCFAK